MGVAILYARFSPRRDEETCESDEIQLDYCRKHAAARGWPVAGEYTDPARSGADADRPGLWQAVDALARGYVLVVYKLDRLARDMYLSEYIRHQVTKKGATVESVCDHGANGTDPGAILFRQLLQAFSEYERQQIRARTSSMMLGMQRAGRAVGSAPYGWVKVGTGKGCRLEPDPDRQAGLQRIIELADTGNSPRTICTTLEAEGIPAQKGTRWHPTSVIRILRHWRRDHPAQAQAQ